MNKLTGLKDVDREVLKHVDDRDLLKFCSVDRRFWNEVCDDNFLRRRLGKYPGIEKYKREDESWKEFFLRAIYRISKMKERFPTFEYIGGNFENKYRILKRNLSPKALLRDAAENGELSLVIFAIQRGADIHSDNGNALYYATQEGHIDVVKYLISKGALLEREMLNTAAAEGHIDLVKYFVDQGIPANHEALREAIRNRHDAIIKYLIENGAGITPGTLRTARNRYPEILSYLRENFNFK